MHIDGTNLILGRVASIAAKHALLGEDVAITNCEKLVVSGGSAVEKYRRIYNMGNVENGPYLQRTPSRFVKRVCKRMLPIRRSHGRAALKHIKCYVGSRDGVEKPVDLCKESAEKLPTLKRITIAELCKALGGKRLI